ncbi:hypothetical protein V3C99_003085, partial [Haemonchus contortus]
ISEMLTQRILYSLPSCLLYSKCLKPKSLLNAVFYSVFLRNVSTKRVEFICGGDKFVGKAKVGDSMLDVVLNDDLPLIGYGACQGTLGCGTCHVILSPEHFERAGRTSPPDEEELDLLDKVLEQTDHSRLGCQVKVTAEDPDTIVVKLPMQRRDARTLE